MEKLLGTSQGSSGGKGSVAGSLRMSRYCLQFFLLILLASVATVSASDSHWCHSRPTTHELRRKSPVRFALNGQSSVISDIFSTDDC